MCIPFLQRKISVGGEAKRKKKRKKEKKIKRKMKLRDIETIKNVGGMERNFIVENTIS
jgi:hypothetical protein